jgi:hypothetical protein
MVRKMTDEDKKVEKIKEMLYELKEEDSFYEIANYCFIIAEYLGQQNKKKNIAQ